MRRVAAFAAFLLALAGLGGCTAEAHGPPPLFERLAPAATGVTFENRLPTDTSFNIVSYLYFYNGAGVAVLDYDGDGLPDLYFTSNAGENRLYHNLGNYRFEDVTARAGVQGPPGWKTGVTAVDVNGDGRPDLYVSAVDHLTMHGHNALYVNNGDGTFTERTREYGLDYDGYGTQAVFFDYDGDGLLDVYLQSHATRVERRIGVAVHRGARDPRTGGRLLHNDGTASHPHFTDVSARAGIYASPEGFGLGVVASDLDGDGCPDLYVANDFEENDYLYRNNCNGTFTEQIARATGHTSRYAMGVDAADMNNDGRPDVFVADMMPEREDVLKSAAGPESYNVFNLRLGAGYHPQYPRNTLQLNRGVVGGQLRFSEVGYLTGTYATDWSWAPLWADLDNDGWKDLFVSSGIYRRPNDLDYINYVGNELVQQQMAREGGRADLEVLQHMPQVPVPNHAFRNLGALHDSLAFEDKAAEWGLGDAGFSNGAVYVDLNNTGALDLVVNRLGAPAAIYRNHARERNGNAFLTLTLRGEGGNTGGIGAKVFAKTRDAHGGWTTQLYEESPTRGFLSSVDPRLHLGLGRSPQVDTLTVVWPSRRFQVLHDVAADQRLTLREADATGRWMSSTDASDVKPVFADVTAQHPADYKHSENAFNDFDGQPLLTHLLSTEGPALAVGDVDGDGLDDLYAGGAKWQPGRLLLQQRDGSFKASPQPDIAADSLSEDVDATFVDVNGDGHPDLVVASGGNEFWGEAEALRPRLYLNDGHGRFRRVADAFPGVFENASCVVAGDFDGDGKIDLFVGARVVARQYGMPPRSHLLRGDGTGHFTDVTARDAPGLADAGMVTSAAWVDYDHDGRLDLVVVGEFTPVHVYHNEGGRLIERTREAGLAGTEGWWTHVRAADLTGTGRMDLVLGNLGLNTYLRASAREPARLYVGDFGHNGTLEQVLTFYKHGVSYPMQGRDDLVRLVPSLRAKFPSYASFGAATIEDILPPEDLHAARVLEAHTFASAIAHNNGDGTFTMRPLPAMAQLAPVYASLTGDFTGAGRRDLLLGGNFWGFQPIVGRADASYGTLLRSAGGRTYTPVQAAASGLTLDGQVRHLAELRAAAGTRLVVVARNDDRLQFLRVRPVAAPALVAARATPARDHRSLR